MNKEEIEEYAFKSVFGESLLKEAKHLSKGEDPPDFVIKIDNNFNIGVEITAYYRDETNARLYNKPNYFDNLSKGIYLHKKDKSILRFATVSIKDSKEKIKQTEVPMIIRKKGSLNNYIEGLTERISIKNNKIKKCNHNLERMNLIILDVENKLNNLETQEIITVLFDQRIVNVIRKSSFNELFLITNFNNNEFVIPLKLNLFHQDIEFLIYTINTDFKKITSDNTLGHISYELFQLLENADITVNIDNKKLTIFKDQYAIIYDESEAKKTIIDYRFTKNPILNKSKLRKYNKTNAVIKKWEYYRNDLTVNNFIKYKSLNNTKNQV